MGRRVKIFRGLPAEVLILVDEFIHHVPQPLDREIDALHVILVGEDPARRAISELDMLG